MKLFKWMKNGGPESRVWGFWLIESKKFFSIALLRFSDGSRDAFHSHAFNSVSWLLKGALHENRIVDNIGMGGHANRHTLFEPSLKHIVTTRDNLHKVESYGTTYVLTFRGPWSDTWKEFIPESNARVTLKNGREIVGVEIL